MEYPEKSSAQGLVCAKADFNIGEADATLHGAAPGAGEGGNPMAWGGNGLGFLSVKLLRASAHFAVFGPRALCVPTAAATFAPPCCHQRFPALTRAFQVFLHP